MRLVFTVHGRDRPNLTQNAVYSLPETKNIATKDCDLYREFSSRKLGSSILRKTSLYQPVSS